MAFDPIPKSVQKIWDAWNIRGFIILSLSLQTILILFAPFRKRTSDMYVISLLWSAYLLADWAAAFVLGLILNNHGDNSVSADYGDLLAFWAPFLLLHLGGPDTITAFAMEDNELWLRHLIGLLVQVSAAFYVFLLTLPENKMVTPTILMLLAGIIKYAERTRALYLASLDSFKESMLVEPDPGPNYAKLMDEFASNKAAKLPARIDVSEEPKIEVNTTLFDDLEEILPEDRAVWYAYRFYEIFKGLIVDLVFNYGIWKYTRSFLHGRTADDAYKVILVELNFMYEALYTKAVMAHSLMGYIVRFFTFGLTISALISFARLSKGGFHHTDVRITYTLLVGGVALDAMGLVMVLFSEWTVVNIQHLARRYFTVGRFVDRSFTPILSHFLTRKAPKVSKLNLGKDIEYDVLDTPLLYRRWGESISAYSLIGYCIKEKPRKIRKPMGCFGYVIHIIVIVITSPFLVILKLLQRLKLSLARLGQCSCCQVGFISLMYANFVWVFKGIFMIVLDRLHITGLKEIYEQMIYVSKNAFPNQLWDVIFRELVDKSHLADDPETAKIISEAKGEWVLQSSSLEINHREVSLMQYVDNVEYDQILLLWHIATDLCYYTEDEDCSKEKNDNREFSKVLSDYLMYLLIIQPQMMSAVAGIGQARFRDTCAEAKRFFHMRGLNSIKPGEGKLKQACEMVLDVNTTIHPMAVKGDLSKSVLFDACILAKELKRLERQQGKNKWEVMCRVWIELLCYAACHCRAATHAEVLNKGGELVTLVWLLMAHLGMGRQFQPYPHFVRAKLVVGT